MTAAAERFTAVAHQVTRDAWAAPTPCADWNVRALLRHVTSEQLWAPHLLRGERLEDVGDDFDGDVLGIDPIGSWTSAIAGALDAWRSVDSPDAPVYVTAGRITVHEYASQMLVDLVVHAWDLACGVGVRAESDDGAVAVALAYTEPRTESGHPDSMFAAPVDTESDDPVERLVALTGRDPDWTT